MLAAILITALESSWAGVRSLLRQLTRFRVNRRWYLVVFLLIPLLRLTPVLLHLAQGGVLPTEELLQQVIVLPLFFFFVALVGGGLDEEMGWRGYALPRLQNVFRPLWANFLLGVIWSCWHIPLWFGSATEHGSLSFPIYLVSTTALSFVLAWVYNGTGNSLLLAVLAHTTSNVADNFRSVILPTNTNPDLDLLFQAVLAGVMVVAALVIAVRTRGDLGHIQRNLP
jgi:membrane protease YdiL (CAAX protease family)